MQRVAVLLTIATLGCASRVEFEREEATGTSSDSAVSGASDPGRTGGATSSTSATTSSASAATTSDGTTDTPPMGDSGPSTSSTTGPPLDDEALCATAEDHRACETIHLTHDVDCNWLEFDVARIENGACLIVSTVASCVPHFGDTSLGCFDVPLECERAPFFSEREDGIGLHLRCGGEPPDGFEPCVYIEPGVFEPPECACQCGGLDPGPGTSGSTSTGSTSGTAE